MKIINDGLPHAIYQAILNDPYDAGDSDYTPTSLITPVRIRALTRRHADDIVEQASGRFWAFLGQAIHSVLERVELPGYLKEQRVYAEIAGKRIGGQFDLFSPEGVVSDFKVTSVWSFIFNNGKAKPEWEAQVNILAALLRRNEHEVTGGNVVAILKDWQENKAQNEPDYPKTPAIEVNVPLWSDDKVVAYITERVNAHEATYELGALVLSEDLPLCTPDERWERPSTWAVMKPGNKRATKVCTSQREAQEHIEVNNLKAEVVKRQGASARCLNYCSVAQFCDFGRAEQAKAQDG